MSDNRTTALEVDFENLVCADKLNNRDIDVSFCRQYAINFLLTDQIGEIGVMRVKKKLSEMLSAQRYSVRYGFHRYHAFEILRTEGVPADELAKHFDLDKITKRRGVSLKDGRLYYRGRIKVEVLHESVKADELELRRASENLVRKDYSPLEEARIFASLKEGHGLSNEAISLFFGGKYTANQINDRLWLLKLPEDVQEKVHTGLWPISKAYDLYNNNGRPKQKREVSSLQVVGKRAFNNAIKAIDEHKTAGHELLDGMTPEELAVARRVLQWARGEQIESLARAAND